MTNLARRAAIASVCSAILLGALKAWAAVETGSVAVLASLADSVLDLFASLVTLGGVHWASQPADEEHRFGHGKAEALAALFQVVVIAISALAILMRAITRLQGGDVSASPESGIAVSMIAIVVTLALTRYQQHVINRTGSVAIGADRIHYTSDLLLNGAVIVALVLDAWGMVGADPVFGIAIAFWLLFGAWRASEAAIDQLMDKEWPEEKRRAFVEVAARHPALKSLHDLRTRSSGAADFVQFHISMNPAMTIQQAHDVVEALEKELGAAFPGTEILIHVDPEGHCDAPENPMIEANLLKDS
ncbi:MULTISPECIES: cation diffusion facilitator family transporter [Sphingomonas]|uniref:Ferrous-iron efflux pump FieF n=1 Tax=Sphingomonas leidyi TaxID=68569 RepID=A0A7X5V0G3_9SPHN|nr:MULTISPECIES: cation diffusion facilitator family transporter [Sphingomonas]MBN8810301.1 cation diffusion facilitator family transporter [Sphingomonas sp.]NIJ65528.1 ferrous-iron efflux pump FieF [Sphingomonas leidyi]OJY50851.1 MAG: divalent metal cation transporter FieF [Sphingomonas sp. 67-41]